MTGYAAQIWNPAAFAPWHAAVRNRVNVPANAWVFADSIGEGVWVSSPIYQNRWLGKTQALVRAAHPTPGVEAGGAGFMPSYYADALIPDETTRTGGGTFTEQSWIWGPGGRSLLVPGTSSGAVTWPAITCDKVRVYYGKTNVAGGQSKVFIDGIDVTNTGTLGGNGTSGASGANLQHSAASKSDGYYWESATLTRAAHTVKVQGTVAAAAAVINGVQFLDGDADRGIHLWDATHSGMNATHLSQSSLDPMYQLLGDMKPRLIMLALGTNDRAGYSVADFLTNISGNLTRIATAMSGVDYTMLLIGGYEPGGAPASTPGKWAQMMAGLAGLATGNTAFVSVQPPWPQLFPDGSTNAGLMFEATNPVHLTSTGATLYAEIIADAISLPTQVRPSTTYLPGNPKAVFS